MDAIRNTYSIVKRCRKAVWRSVKNNCLVSSFRRRRGPTTKRSPENSFDGLTTIAQETAITSNGKLSDTTIDDRSEIIVDHTSAVVDLTKTEESIHSDIQEEPSQNIIDEPEKKKTRKRQNRKRCKITMTSDEVNQQDVVIVEDDRTKSFDLSPISSVEKTDVVETVSKISLRDDHNEIELPEIGECGNKFNDDANEHFQTETASATTVSWRVKSVNDNEHLEYQKFGSSNENIHCETPRITISSIGEGKSRRKVVHMYLTSNKNVKLNRTDNAWIPTIAARQTVAAVDDINTVVAVKNIESYTSEKINKQVRSILNKIAPENISELIKSFMELPINTIERMENAVDLVFEKVIQEQGFAPLYAALCSAMQSVQITCTRSNKTTSFKMLMVNKCKSLFKSDKANQTSSMKILEEINLCRDPEKKKELTLEYKENERKLHKRSVGNCCFIGQLFNQHIINVKIVQYCIAYLICQRSDDPIECLCYLLKTCGKELERWCNLNDTFISLKSLACVKSLSLRIRFMTQNIVELRSNKWLSRRSDIKNDKSIDDKTRRGNINRPAAVVANVLIPKSDGCKQTQRQMNSKISENSVKVTERVEPDSAEMDDKIRNLCNDIIKEYEALNNLDDVIYSLVDDEKSCIRTRHQHFVTSTLMITLDCSPNIRSVVGKMFAELLVRNVLTMTEINRGIDTVLKEWNDYVMDYPNFFSYIAAIVAPLLTSKTASFDFYNLKCACSSIRRSGNSSDFFVEVLKTILCSEDAQNVQNDAVDDFGGAVRVYNMWSEQTKHVPLSEFIPDNEINKFLKNDQLGVLLLSMAMFDISNKVEDNKSLYKMTHKWISKNINLEIVKVDDFVRSLTVATVIVCSNKFEDDLNGDLLDRDRDVLIKEHIRSTCDFSTTEILAREIQCIRGVQAISAIFRREQKSEELKLRLLHELCRVRAINSDSIDL